MKCHHRDWRNMKKLTTLEFVRKTDYDNSESYKSEKRKCQDNEETQMANDQNFIVDLFRKDIIGIIQDTQREWSKKEVVKKCNRTTTVKSPNLTYPRFKNLSITKTEETEHEVPKQTPTSSSKKELVITRTNTRTILSEEAVQKSCQAVWKIFLNKFETSVSHTNNNIQKYEEQYDVSQQSLRKRTNDIAQKPFIDGFDNTDNDKNTMNNLHKKTCNFKIRLNIFVVFFISLCQLLRTILKSIGIIILIFVVSYCMIALHKPTQALISRNTQDLIYPFMRALRLISLPVVKRLPILTDYYEESCLLPNPFYETDNLGCWPCENVRHVIDLTGFSNFSQAYHHSGVPFIVKDAFHDEIGIKQIQEIYSANQHTIGKAFVVTNKAVLTTLDDVFAPINDAKLQANDFHLRWNINRVTSARVFRKYFPKPYFISSTTEVSVQHFLFIDRVAAKSYRLPMTEFANVFLTQASGSRSIVLIPTKDCQHDCKVVSAILQPKDVLFYNWLFWNPMSVPTDISTSFSPSVTFLGSFY